MIVRKTLVYVAIVAILFLFLIPIVWAFLTSLKTHVDAWTLPPKWIFTPSFHNYSDVLFKKRFIHFFWNSGIVAAMSTVISLTIGSLTGYALERFQFHGRNLIFFGVLFAYMVPATVIALPIYVVAANLSLLDTYIILILTHSTFNTAFACWMMRGFFKEIPRELEEYAWIDGCSFLSAFMRITLPLAAPGLVATAIFCIIFSWNDFPFALILSGFKTKTLPVAVGQLETPWGTFWGEIAASSFTGVIPIFVFSILVQKWLVRGLTLGAIK